MKLGQLIAELTALEHFGGADAEVELATGGLRDRPARYELEVVVGCEEKMRVTMYGHRRIDNPPLVPSPAPRVG